MASGAFRREVAPFTGELTLLPIAKDLTALGELRRLTLTNAPAYNPRWTADSAEILFSGKGGLWRLRIAGDGAAERLPFVGEDGATPVLSAPQGDRATRLAYVRVYTDHNIWRVDTASPGAPATSPPVVAIASTRRDAIAHFAPDGRHVTFTSMRSGDNEIWRADSSGADAVQLTFMGANPGWPRWSPGGDQIAFHSNPDGNAEIFLVPAEGGKPRNLTSHPAVDTFPTFSRDGRWVYLSSTRAGAPAIWKMPAAGGPAIQVTTGLGMMAIESEDGTQLYYTESATTNTPATLWRVPVAGGAAVKLTEGVNSTSFDVVKNGIYYLAQIAGETQLRYFDLASRMTTTVAGNLGNVDFGLAASPDGRSILFTRTDSSVNDLMLVDDFR